jgi:membrane-bound ClpP family serine protease
MSQNSTRDLVAALAILLMFAGALVLPISSYGLVLIGFGLVAILSLMLRVVRERR